MYNITKVLYIKDLLVLQAPSIYKMIEGTVQSAKRKNLFIGDLVVNPYIYDSRSLDVSYLFKYLEALDKVANVFRKLYDEFLYSLRLEGIIDDELYSGIDNFHMIYNAINNTFNSYLVDQYLFQDFGIYRSPTSLETCTKLYETFNDYCVYSLIDIVNDPARLKLRMFRQNIKYLNYIYDELFEQFEPIYLPFY